jgi:integrase/recombinase XerC
MSTELATVPPAPHFSPPAIGEVDLIKAFLSGRKETTLRAYDKDLRDFGRFVGAPSPSAAVELLLGLPHGEANAAVLAYRAHMTDRGLAAATVARRLAALRSLVKLARTLGRVTWEIDIQSPRVEPYRDVTGPGQDGWRSLWRVALEAGDSPKGLRDRALLRLMRDLALRRGETIALDVADVDLELGTVSVIGKGKTAPIRLTLNDPTKAALSAWLAVRPGTPEGPCFVHLHTASTSPARLTGDGVAWIVRDLGRRAGITRRVRPHGLRHQGITRALDLVGGDVRRVQKFSRHAKIDTLMKYDDARRDDAGSIARLLGEDTE